MFVNAIHRFRWAQGVMGVLLAVAVGAPAFAEDPKGVPTPAQGEHPRVRLVTSVGEIVIELFPDKAPITVKNFLQYVRDGYYDGVAFHRVKADFMIQAGGYNADLSERTKGLRPPIKNESANLLKNERGTVSMARMSDPHSATCQFFINVVDNPHLDRDKSQPYGYTVFGKVVEGMEVVDRIQRARTIQHPKDPRKGEDGPVNPDPPITIKEAMILESQAAEAPAPTESTGPTEPEASAKPTESPAPDDAPAEPVETPAPDDAGGEPQEGSPE